MRQIKLETPDTYWTTAYLGDTIDALRAHGIEVSDNTAAHLTPAQHDHINFYLDNSPLTCLFGLLLERVGYGRLRY